MTSTGDVLDEGRRAFERRHWGDAYAGLAVADARADLEPADLELLATAAYLTGRDGESTDAWMRAHHGYLEKDAPAAAVRSAFWLGFGLVQRGEVAQGGGWLSRAHRLVDERNLDCAGCGYLLVPAGLMSLGGGDPSAARETFDEVRAIGERFGDADLVALGTLGRGQALARMGRMSEGVSLFDEVMVSVTAGEVSSVVSGIAYCAVIDECQEAFDVRRAHEWTEALARWCDAQPDLVPYRGQCLVHRSQVMQLHGEWSEALREAEQARDRLSEPPHAAIGMAHYQLGELQRLRGRFTDAEESYRRGHEHGRSPQPGLALLRLAQGRVETATAAIDGAVAAATDHVVRAKLLPAFVEIMVAAGRVGEARAAADELVSIAAGSGVPYLQAAAAQAEGAVLLAEGNPRGALEHLRNAWREWREVEAPYEAAQARVLIALACREVDDHDTVDLECHAARRTFEDLDAVPARARLVDLFGLPGAPAGDGDLSPRELEVLRLVATGKTNRDIAEELFISEKTVERHVSNIFVKLGVSNRAAATAAAYDRHLV